jgi:hypothetical protein
MKAIKEFEVSVRDAKQLSDLMEGSTFLRAGVEWTSTTTFEIDANDEEVSNEIYLLCEQFEIEQL